MGFQGDLMFFDVEAAARSLEEDSRFDRIVDRDPEVPRDCRFVDFVELAYGYKRMIGSKVSGPFEIDNFALHVYKGTGMVFYFLLIPSYSASKGGILGRLFHKLNPPTDFWKKRKQLFRGVSSGASLDPAGDYLVNFRVGSTDYWAYDRLLKQHDWEPLAAEFHEMAENREDFLSYIRNGATVDLDTARAALGWTDVRRRDYWRGHLESAERFVEDGGLGRISALFESQTRVNAPTAVFAFVTGEKIPFPTPIFEPRLRREV